MNIPHLYSIIESHYIRIYDIYLFLNTFWGSYHAAALEIQIKDNPKKIKPTDNNCKHRF